MDFWQPFDKLVVCVLFFFFLSCPVKVLDCYCWYSHIVFCWKRQKHCYQPTLLFWIHTVGVIYTREAEHMSTLLFEMINFAPIIHKSIINLVTNVLKKKKACVKKCWLTRLIKSQETKYQASILSRPSSPGFHKMSGV